MPKGGKKTTWPMRLFKCEPSIVLRSYLSKLTLKYYNNLILVCIQVQRKRIRSMILFKSMPYIVLKSCLSELRITCACQKTCTFQKSFEQGFKAFNT